MWHSHLNDMEIPETKSFIPKGFEFGTALSKPSWSIEEGFQTFVGFRFSVLPIQESSPLQFDLR